MQFNLVGLLGLLIELDRCSLIDPRWLPPKSALGERVPDYFRVWLGNIKGV